jgi:ComF family protein
VHSVDGRFRRGLRVLLPPRCLLCGGRGTDGRDLCAACEADLAPNTPCCPLCALSLATAAPACGACLRRAPPFAAAWVPFRYGHPLDLLEGRFKFHADLAAGRVLAELLVARAAQAGPALPQLLVPVPLHQARLRARGYNQALELARPLACALGLPLRHDLLARSRATAAQTGLDAKTRRRNLHGAFEAAPASAWPDHVALLDDVMTTGATLGEATRTLRRAGVARVDVWALARAP